MKLFFDTANHKDFVNHMLSADLLREEGKWEFTSNLYDADVVPVDYYMYKSTTELNKIKLQQNQILLVWYYENHGDHCDPNYYREDTKHFFEKHNKTIIFHTNEIDNYDPQHIPCNVLFNRQKMFCIDYSDKCENLQWTSNIPKVAFELTDINKNYSVNNKTFLFPNRIFRNETNQRNLLRIKLKDFLESINANMYTSDPEMSIFLNPNGISDISTINTTIGGHWYPIDNYYYNTSYVGIHVETIIRTSSIFYPSEKYFDIFIKGNFPLVFSCLGTISNLKKIYGFKFPDWIDYSYDEIDSIDERIDSFTNSIKKVSEKSLDELHDLYLRDKHILDHNKNIFFTRPYYSPYDRIKESIEKLGW